ncbi:DUF4190 domain-containing protein [Rhodococcus sp. ARC_M12]|uniref:DUF4190 domain-containing protein n=1 Tax=Rhodococcus sp. ARC_M12 TaxID=2928854 RepID=UPI001FB1CCDB|nr:DUF4190 domain-containing protein [Rhodococcus sp. ARC_M12]MCJ0979003.1 DUF4190 domain-containing protein [Rhodococcus sp. ARC_M12]
MGYPQGNFGPFDKSEGDEPDPGQQQYPPYQNTQQPNPQYPNPQYGYAPYAGGYQTPPTTNTLAVVSLVLAILGLTFIPLIASVCAVVCGHISRGQIRRTGEGGSGLATAGLIVGYVSIALFVIVIVGAIVLFAIAAANTSTY